MKILYYNVNDNQTVIRHIDMAYYVHSERILYFEQGTYISALINNISVYDAERIINKLFEEGKYDLRLNFDVEERDI